ncbi:MAG: N-methyl-L-tryptophan oxidase [Nakamurella sp.]
MSESYDVIVLGLGGMGSAAAYHLARRGVRVLGLDRFGPAHDQGSSHGDSRIIRQAYYEDPAYVPLLERAFELWAELEPEVPGGNMQITGGLLIGRPDSRIIVGSTRSVQQWNLPHEILSSDEVSERYPTFTLGADDVGLFEPNAGFVRPERTVTAHIDLARRAGATLRFGETVRSWQADSSVRGVTVTTDTGMITAGNLVIAPGAWAPELLPEIPLVVERQVMYWFAPSGDPARYDPSRHPVYIGANPAGREFYGFPASEGPTGGAKVAFFRQHDQCTPDTINRDVTLVESQEMAQFIGSWLPTLPGRLLRAATCLYTTTPDGHFVVGPHSQYPQVVIACGFSGHGFKFVPVIGEILADLATEAKTRQPIYPLFDPERRALGR